MRVLTVEYSEERHKVRRKVVCLLIGFGCVYILISSLVMYGALRSGCSIGEFIFILIFLLIGIFLIVFAIVGSRRAIKRESAYFTLIPLLEFKDDEIRLPSKMEVEYGVLEMARYKIGDNRYSYYIFNSVRKATTDRIPFLDEEFKIICYTDIHGVEEGYAKVPVVKITSGKYKGVTFIFLTNRGRVDTAQTLVISEDGDYVQVSLQGLGKTIKGNINGTIKKARGARVEVRLPDPTKGYKIELINIKRSGIVYADFTSKILPDERILVILPEGWGFRALAELLREHFKPPFVMGLGEFKIRVVLDMPLKKDVVKEGTLTISLKEN